MSDDLEVALRAARLQLALHERGLSGQDNKRVARLLDGVQYDESGQPTNVDEAIASARDQYGDAIPAPAEEATPTYGQHAGAREAPVDTDEGTGLYVQNESGKYVARRGS